MRAAVSGSMRVRPPILIETVRDNVASKMNALVDRGAPRDFLDIRAVIVKGLVSVEECWALWQRPIVEHDLISQRVRERRRGWQQINRTEQTLRVAGVLAEE